MNKRIGLVLAVCLISAMVTAETAGEKKGEQKRKDAGVSRQRQENAPEVPLGRARRSGQENRQEAYREMLEKRKGSHQKAIAELEAIKKIAEEENAVRTVEALQKMIDKKNAEFKQRAEQFEKQRRERSKQLQQRRGRTPEGGRPAGKTEKKEGK